MLEDLIEYKPNVDILTATQLQIEYKFYFGALIETLILIYVTGTQCETCGRIVIRQLIYKRAKFVATANIVTNSVN